MIRPFVTLALVAGAIPSAFADEAERVRAEHGTGEQIAQRCAQSEATEQEHEDEGGSQQQKSVLKREGLRMLFHEAAFRGEGEGLASLFRPACPAYQVSATRFCFYPR